MESPHQIGPVGGEPAQIIAGVAASGASPQFAAASEAKVARCPFAKIFGRDKTGSLAKRLKESTKELHHAAEHHPLQQSIVRGTISKSDYASFASAMRRVHSVMESQLDTLSKQDTRIGAIFVGRHRRLAAFDRDIALLGGCVVATPEVQPSDWLGGSTHIHPLAWLGVLYVVEGSSNGGQAIARILRRTWNVGDDTLTSLDPHGSDTRAFWEEFRTTLDAQQFSTAEQDAIIAGAAATFAGITRLMDSVSHSAMPTA